MSSSDLVLGPLLRHVDTTSASVWVKTREAGRVQVHATGRSWSARTFAVHGHHYALVEVDGLQPGSTQPYSVSIDGSTVWPEPDSPFPASVISTRAPGSSPRIAFGSCRNSVGHDEQSNRAYGVDTLRAWAREMAAGSQDQWPDLVLYLGDQVYADEITAQMREFIESRRDIDQPPGAELQDYAEYAHLYQLAWSDPANRWLLSTVPSAMIFDDHDIRDDWNTSHAWRRRMEATPWWHTRIVAGLASYWVYQHLGNLSPAARTEDEIWQRVASAHDGAPEPDLSATLDAFAERVDQDPETYRWSYTRDLDDVRLVVIDSRAARVLTAGERSMLDAVEQHWLNEQLQGGVRHLLIGTSLPFLLSPGLHHFEAWDEALASGAWGPRFTAFAERLREGIDLEHWAAFGEGFRAVAAMVLEVAEGRRGPAPKTIAFLSGDVHHSYVSQVTSVGASPPGVRPVEDGGRSVIVQAVCSPIRKPLPRPIRLVMRFLASETARGIGWTLARSARVPEPPFSWRPVRGPWFDNNLAFLQTSATGLAMQWRAGRRGSGARTRTVRVASVEVSREGVTGRGRLGRWRRRLERYRALRS